jgi:hypothetical protein
MDNSATNDKLSMIKRQTNYSDEDDAHILERLEFYEGDAIKVIKEHFGMAIQKKQEPITSVNQEIYKQFREKLQISGKQF